MTRTLRLAGSLAAAAILATATVPALAADVTGHRIYAMVAQNGSGELGTVTLTSLGERTRVEIALVDAPASQPQPAHVHEGPCAKLNPKPMYPLALVVDGLSISTLNVPMSKLVAGGFAVNVHESTTNISKYVACGDLTAAK